VALAHLRGAGQGALTASLANAAGHVVAVERDPAWARAPRVRFADDEHARSSHAQASWIRLSRKTL